MLWLSLLALLGFLIAAFILGYLFLVPVVVIGLNIIILYFLFLRIYTEITKHKRGEIYAYSYVAAFFLLLLTHNFLPLWWITTATLLAFAITQVYVSQKKKR